MEYGVSQQNTISPVHMMCWLGYYPAAKLKQNSLLQCNLYDRIITVKYRKVYIANIMNHYNKSMINAVLPQNKRSSYVHSYLQFFDCQLIRPMKL